ncbi:hypothetical protein ILYODFUR_033472 [Ilyodon furcidens]|uniref:Uncharacterized protein n=1 Tax=Ilyodon furcidens TaxID=33524 RepID=A0ABV0STF6_9TELE
MEKPVLSLQLHYNCCHGCMSPVIFLTNCVCDYVSYTLNQLLTITDCLFDPGLQNCNTVGKHFFVDQIWIFHLESQPFSLCSIKLRVRKIKTLQRLPACLYRHLTHSARV